MDVSAVPVIHSLLVHSAPFQEHFPTALSKHYFPSVVVPVLFASAPAEEIMIQKEIINKQNATVLEIYIVVLESYWCIFIKLHAKYLKKRVGCLAKEELY